MRARIVSIAHWFTRDLGAFGQERVPTEAIALRAFGAAMLVFLLAEDLATRPHPGLHGRGLQILVATVVLIAASLSALRRPAGAGPAGRSQGIALTRGRHLLALVLITAASGALAILQPNGIWPAGPIYVGILAAFSLDRRQAVAIVILSVTTLVVISELADRGNNAITVVTSTIGWFLMMLLARALRDQRDELAASRAAQARAAAAAERGRIAREMHDVLAHSLSALALTLESTRLLARDRGTDAKVCEALDRAHHLAAGGLQEARRAVAAARGEELPGPERLPLLVDAFAQQSGLQVELQISGEPGKLAPDAGLALYRTAQEALTNVRRHAAAERVEVSLVYEDSETVLTVTDHGRPELAAVGLGALGAGVGSNGGYGLSGMRERAALLGGDLQAQPTADGFSVRLSLPVGDGAPQARRR